MMMCNVLKKYCASLSVLFLLFITATSVQAVEPKRMILYPTDVTKAGDLSYLGDSLRLMFASRLSPLVDGEVLMKQKMNKQRDLASYRMQSSLASTQAGITLSATVYKPSDKKPLHFKTTATSPTGLMVALDELVADIDGTLFHVQKGATGKEDKKRKADSEIDLSTAHPDRAMRRNGGLGLSIGQEDFVADAIGLEVQATDRYKSKVLPVQAEAMTAGDIDGDSLDEIVLVTNARVLIYQLQKRKIEHLVTVPLEGGLKVHAVNVADLNNNGIMEIYISATRDKEPRSFVMEWSPSTGTKWLYKNVYWYLRPVHVPGKGVILAGQQSGVGSMVAPRIYRLRLQPDQIVSTDEQLALPQSVNLFNFVFADLDGDQFNEVVAITKKEQLKVYNSNLDLLYTTPSGFGGRELNPKGLTVPIRLVVADFDGDGRQDIIAVDNELYSPKMMNKTRLYKNGQVRGMLWDGLGFAEMWHTNLFQHSVLDFQFLSGVKPLENGEQLKGRLFVLEPEKGDLLEGYIFGMGGDRVSVYGMEFTSEGGIYKE